MSMSISENPESLRSSFAVAVVASRIGAIVCSRLETRRVGWIVVVCRSGGKDDDGEAGDELRLLSLDDRGDIPYPDPFEFILRW